MEENKWSVFGVRPSDTGPHFSESGEGEDISIDIKLPRSYLHGSTVKFHRHVTIGGKREIIYFNWEYEILEGAEGGHYLRVALAPKHLDGMTHLLLEDK